MESQQSSAAAQASGIFIEEERAALRRMVDIRPVKDLARRSLPMSSRLRELILGEDDFLPAWLFVAYVAVWLRLLSLERRSD